MNMPGVSLVDVALAATQGQLGASEAARSAVRDLLALKPGYASGARQELGKWFDDGIVAQLVDGLQKAGLDVAPDTRAGERDAAAPRSSSLAQDVGGRCAAGVSARTRARQRRAEHRRPSVRQQQRRAGERILR